ncbi:hypothetical protein HYW32_00950 [Candidatus Berkelbacteria bacterium]|nr:hypothetical protein [Candidatus Berkelbacteria bacterium]
MNFAMTYHNLPLKNVRLPYLISLTAGIIFALILLFSYNVTFSRTVGQIHGATLPVILEDEKVILTKTNTERLLTGLPDLKWNSNLQAAAQAKARDMFSGQYFEHISPVGVTPWSFIEASHYQYQMAGENLAAGFLDQKQVVPAWMESDTHRANILSADFQDIGVAVVKGTLEGKETVLVVQMFGTSATNVK